MLPPVEPVEIGDPVNAKQHGLPIKNELFGSDAAGSLNDQRITAPVITVAGVQADSVAIAGNDEAKAVLFDLVNPVGM
jgi:hypothetical protein